jgi:putative addiction module killer protein
MIIRQTERFAAWFEGLRDRQAARRIQMRIDRLAAGNPGQHRVLSGGVVEMKIDDGPGYRVYFTQRGIEIVVLLCGGDKRTQQADIKTALKLAARL